MHHLKDPLWNVAGWRVGEQMECMENDQSILNMEKFIVENDGKNNNWRSTARIKLYEMWIYERYLSLVKMFGRQR